MPHKYHDIYLCFITIIQKLKGGEGMAEGKMKKRSSRGAKGGKSQRSRTDQNQKNMSNMDQQDRENMKEPEMQNDVITGDMTDISDR